MKVLKIQQQPVVIPPPEYTIQLSQDEMTDLVTIMKAANSGSLSIPGNTYDQFGLVHGLIAQAAVLGVPPFGGGR